MNKCFLMYDYFMILQFNFCLLINLFQVSFNSDTANSLEHLLLEYND